MEKLKKTSLTRISDSDGQQLVQNVTDDLDGMGAGLMTNRVSNKEFGARQSGCLANVGTIVFEVWQSSSLHKFVKDMTGEIEGAERVESKSYRLSAVS